MEKLESSRLVTKILKFTNPQWKSLEISTFIAQQFGNLQIQRGEIQKYPDLLQKELEKYKSIGEIVGNLKIYGTKTQNFQIQYTKTWKLTNSL